jgi:hypothetical protein
LMYAVIIRDAMVVVLVGLVIREMWRPQLDVVRSGGLDDPGGGAYDRAPDGPLVTPVRPPPAPVDTSEDLRNSMSAP